VDDDSGENSPEEISDSDDEIIYRKIGGTISQRELTELQKIEENLPEIEIPCRKYRPSRKAPKPPIAEKPSGYNIPLYRTDSSDGDPMKITRKNSINQTKIVSI
jgi:hypothetical protein